MNQETILTSWRAVSAAALLALLSACASTPAGMNAPRSGGADVPSQWQYGGAPTGRDARAALTLDEAWWQRFQDPQLDALIERALSRNTDLAVAALRVRQAQLRADIADAARLPEVSARIGANASRPLESGGATTRTSSASLNASWELDLWGRVKSQSDAAQWEAQATEEDRRALALSLSGTVARLYWQLAYLDQRVSASEQSLAYARQTAQLVITQHKVGSVSGLEEAQARQAVSTQESALAQLVQARVEARQSLALLLDEPSQTSSLPAQPRWPQVERPVIEPGLPADTLARRPDLRAAEARLRKAYAAVDTTRTSYYPTLSLTGSVGGSSETLSNVLSNPVGTLGAALVLPFLQWRDMQRNVAVSQAEADAAVLGFRQTLYQALADVDKALSAQVQLQTQVQAQGERLTQAQKVERLSELRYRAGAEPLKTWLDAQESRSQAELAQAEVRYNQLSNWVALVQALGGGPTR
ncbi:MAG TPA: efflux transporter outer membrane subunit [Aquabacterium sp.]|nr:efflux transporter outer membrane subunit [Aquabacterium sp.]